MSVSGPTHDMAVGPGLELRCSFPSLDSIRVALAVRGREFFDRVFTPTDGQSDFDIEWPFVRARGEIEMNMFSGELWCSGHFSINPPGGGGDWREVFEFDRKVLMRFSPAIGSIGGSTIVDEPVLSETGFGRTQLCTPSVLRVYVDERETSLADVGSIVKREMFPDHPDFVFNTVACVGRPENGGPGLYTDPESHWFNVFLGYYQLDAPKHSWSRPFGYVTAGGAGSEVAFDDLIRLGESDWNWFSNWMYGVPYEVAKPYSAFELDEIPTRVGGPERIGASEWHAVEMRNVEVASTYESGAKGAARLADNSVVDPIWRRSFGRPCPRPEWPESFIPTVLDAKLLIAYWEDDDAFHTVMFGGTSHAGGDQDFLAAQMEAVRAVIGRSYPRLGFSAAGDAARM